MRSCSFQKVYLCVVKVSPPSYSQACHICLHIQTPITPLMSSTLNNDVAPLSIALCILVPAFNSSSLTYINELHSSFPFLNTHIPLFPLSITLLFYVFNCQIQRSIIFCRSKVLAFEKARIRKSQQQC